MNFPGQVDLTPLKQSIAHSEAGEYDKAAACAPEDSEAYFKALVAELEYYRQHPTILDERLEAAKLAAAKLAAVNAGDFEKAAQTREKQAAVKPKKARR